jgi:hypothetical protein
MEIIAAILYFSNFLLSAMAVSLAVMLFRHHRNFGWLVLAAAFSSPFAFLLMRLVSGHPLFTYRILGPAVSGAGQVTYRIEIPGFYILVVAALLLLTRNARHENQA